LARILANFVHKSGKKSSRCIAVGLLLILGCVSLVFYLDSFGAKHQVLADDDVYQRILPPKKVQFTGLYLVLRPLAVAMAGLDYGQYWLHSSHYRYRYDDWSTSQRKRPLLLLGLILLTLLLWVLVS